MELREQNPGRRDQDLVPPEGEPSPEFLARQQTYNGFGDALAMAFEMVVTPLVFGLGGYGLDRWLGTAPVFMVILGLVGIIGMSAKMWYSYDARMRLHEASGPWARTSVDATPPVDSRSARESP